MEDHIAGSVVFWEEMQSSILSQISEADSSEKISSSVFLLFSLTDEQLSCFLCSKEGLAMMRSNIVAENKSFRLIFVQLLGKLLLRGWLILSGDLDMEGLVRFESRAEAKRAREDFFDACVEIFKSFAFGCIGKAPSADPGATLEDDFPSMCAYCEVIGALLEAYNEAQNQLSAWMDALLGFRGSGSRYVENNSAQQLAQVQVALVPLLRPVLSIIFSDPHLLIARCRAHPAHTNTAIGLVSNFMMVLLRQVQQNDADTSTSSSLLLLDLAASKSYLPMFAAGKEVDVTLGSRSGDAPLPVVQYVSDWVSNTLLFLLATSTQPPQMFALVKDVAALTQHELMAQCRTKTASALLSRIFYLLEAEDFLVAVAAAAGASRVSVTNELVALATLTLRYLPALPPGALCAADSDLVAATPTQPLYGPLTRLLRVVSGAALDDDILQTRVFAELSVLLVNAAVTECATTPTALANASTAAAAASAGDSSAATNDLVDTAAVAAESAALPVVRFDISLSHFGRLLLDPAVMSQADNRLLTALLHTLHRTIEWTLSVMHEFIPHDDEQPSQQQAGSTQNGAAAPPQRSDDLLNNSMYDMTANSSASDIAATAAGANGLPSSSAAAWTVANSELFIAQNPLFLQKLKLLAAAAGGTPVPALPAHVVTAQLGVLCEWLLRQLQAVLFVMKVCGERCLRWPVDGDVGDSVPQSVAALMELAAALLLAEVSPASFGDSAATIADTGKQAAPPLPSLSACGAIKRYLLAHRYTQTVRSLSHGFVACVDKLLESLQSGAAHIAFSVLVTSPHMLRVSALAAAHLPAMRAVSGNDDLATSLLGYLKLLLRTSETRRALFRNALRDRVHEGPLGGAMKVTSQFANADHDAVCLALQLHAIDMIAQIASDASVAAVSTVAALNGSSNGVRNGNSNSTSNNSSNNSSSDGLAAAACRILAELQAEHLCAASDSGVRAHLARSANAFEGPPTSTSALLGERLAMHLRRLEEQQHNGVGAGGRHLKGRQEDEDEEEEEVVERRRAPSAQGDACERLLATDVLAQYCDNDDEDEGDEDAEKQRGKDMQQKQPQIRNGLAKKQSSALLDFAGGSNHDLAADGGGGGGGGHGNSKNCSSNAATQLSRAPFTRAQWSSVATAAAPFDTVSYAKLYGLFTPHNIAARAVNKPYACTTDIVGLVDDVLSAHVRCVRSSCGGGVNGRNNNSSSIHSQLPAATATPLSLETWCGALHTPRERRWSQVSGSSDLLTVLVATTFDPLAVAARVQVRVINSAGFKIPYFTLQITVASCISGGDAVSGGSSNSSNSSATVAFDGEAIYRATGAEYFLPDALVERSFAFPVTAFAPLAVTARLLYPDLQCDEEEDLFEVPPSGGGGPPAASPRAKRQPFRTALSESFFGVNGGGAGGSSNTKLVGVLDCAPLRLPLTTFLLPYGAGIFSAMRYWKRDVLCASSDCGETRLAGLPLSVFHSLWRRAESFHASRRFAVGGHLLAAAGGGGGGDAPLRSSCLHLCERVATAITAATVELINSAARSGGAEGRYLCGMDARVAVREAAGCDVLHPFVKVEHGGSGGGGGDGSETFVAWGFQTLWGAEIACKLLVDCQQAPAAAAYSTAKTTAGGGGAAEAQPHQLLTRSRSDSQSQSQSALISNAFDVYSASGVGGAVGDDGGNGDDLLLAGAAPSERWSGRLEVRCSDAAALEAVQGDLKHFLYAISGGAMWS